MDKDERERARTLQRIAKSYLRKNNPPLFCGRLPLLEDGYSDLMDSDADNGKRILAVGVEEYDQSMNGLRYGKTRLLEQLAGKAARDGHIPCLVSLDNGENPPSTILAVGVKFALAIRQTRTEFGLPLAAGETLETIKLQSLTRKSQKSPPRFSAAVQDAVNNRDWSLKVENDGNLVKDALQADLEGLVADTARLKFRPRDGTAHKVLILVDDVHRFGAATSSFCTQLLDRSGLSRPGAGVRVAFTYSTKVGTEYGAGKRAIDSFVALNRDDVRGESLRAFGDPVREWLPYGEFLLSQTPPLVISVRDTNDPQLSEFRSDLKEAIEGAPSEFTSKSARIVIRVYNSKSRPVLAVANDQEVVEMLTKPLRPPGA